MPTHLRFDMRDAYYSGKTEHPQLVMKELGIGYEFGTPQSIADQWWFWNCENVPNPLPDFISVLTNADPNDWR